MRKPLNFKPNNQPEVHSRRCFLNTDTFAKFAYPEHYCKSYNIIQKKKQDNIVKAVIDFLCQKVSNNGAFLNDLVTMAMT